MVGDLIKADDQPIGATFFGEGRWLTDFITPEDLEVQELHDALTRGLPSIEQRIRVCWDWVANEVQYVRLVPGKLTIAGKTSYQKDLWNLPSITRRVKVGNCANKAFLLASLLRNELPANNVKCVLGNLYNGKAGGHAWVQINFNGQDYIVEATRSDVKLVPAFAADRYEAVHLFNDKEVYAVEGKTVLEPFTACFSTWLRDYLDWSYIRGEKS